MTNQEAMCKLSPEEFYHKLKWLWVEYGPSWSMSEAAIINWLKEEADT